jgi:zinc/manganese transport system permease protein
MMHSVTHASLSLAGVLPPFTPNLIQDARDILQFGFMRQALLAGTALAVVAGLVGYYVVLRHQAFAGESLSDVAFAGALGGAAFGLNPLATLLGATILVALAMGGMGERLRGRDVAIGTLLAWVLGLGALFLRLFSMRASGRGVGISGISVLFGNLLGIGAGQLRVIVLVSLAVAVVLALIGRPLLFASLDADVAAARGVPVRALGLAFMALLAVTVSEATLAVGALLVFALLLLPAAIAHQLTPRPEVALAAAVVIAVLLTWIGSIIGFYTGFPGSVCISLLAFASYVAVVGGGQAARWSRSQL